MKIKILILTIVLVLAGTFVLGLTFVNLTQEEAYESAVKHNAQFEIDELNLELKEISHENTLKAASILALNNYTGQITKYYTPFVSETNLEVEKSKAEKTGKQLEIDMLTAALNLNNASIEYDEAEIAFSEAKAAYNEALKNPDASTSEKLALEYTMESQKIAIHQAQNTLDNAQRILDGIIGLEGVAVILPSEYKDPYKIDLESAYKISLSTDMSIYQAKRNAEAARIKFEIADKFFNENEELYISALSGLKSSELTYEKALISLEISVKNEVDNLKNKYDAILLAELNKKIKKNEYNASLAQYKAGILSLSSLENSENSYIYSQKQLETKIQDYVLASMKFTLNYGYEF